PRRGEEARSQVALFAVRCSQFGNRAASCAIRAASREFRIRELMGPLAGFFGLAFAVMWVLFTTVAVAVPAGTPLGQALILAGAAAPAIAALVVTVATDGRAGVRAFLARLFLRQTSALWYVLALVYM